MTHEKIVFSDSIPDYQAGLARIGEMDATDAARIAADLEAALVSLEDRLKPPRRTRPIQRRLDGRRAR